MNLDDPTSTLNNIYAAVGRAMVLAVNFEHSCYAVALLAGSFHQLEANGIVVLEDPQFGQRVFDDLQKKMTRLSGRIDVVFASLPIDQFRNTVEEGRKARNKLVHDLLKPHDVLISHEVGRAMLVEDLTSLVTKITVADGVMTQLLSVLSGNGSIEGDKLLENTRRAAMWAMGVATQEN